MSRSPNRFASGFALISALALGGWLILLASRMLAVRSGYGDYIDCRNCLDGPVLLQDLLPTGVLFVLAAVAAALRAGILRLLPLLLTVALLCVYAIDLGVYLIFGFRLRITDVLRYGGEAKSSWSVVLPLLSEWRGTIWLAGWLLALTGWIALIWRIPRDSRTAMVAGFLGSVMVAISVLANPADYVHANAYRDVVRSNRPDGVNRPFSPDRRAALLAQPQDIQISCKDAVALPRRSVILLVVESLSAYHSRLLGEVQDNTPRLDEWARNNSYFPEFHANGFTTDGGLIALLTGRVPLPSIGRYESSKAYAGYEMPVVPALFSQLHAAGYSSQFFTTGDLGFLDKGRWARDLGFMHVEGANHPFYASYPRGGFDDAGDQALYDRYLDWYDRERKNGPLFSTLLTVSTHPPFHVPGTTIHDEAKAFRWADAQIDRFIQGLAMRRFFDDGILLVTGDHRTMTIVRPAETVHFGAGALSRVPMVVIGPSGLRQGSVPGRWQQTDFLAGLMTVAGLPSCTDAFRGRMLGPDAMPARYVLHAQGVQRDRVQVWIQDDVRSYELILNGDDTGWMTQPDKVSADRVLEYVNRERARLTPLPPDQLDSLIKRRLDVTPGTRSRQ